MTTWHAALLTLALAGPLAAQAPAWHTDLARARADARKAGKPLFVVFRCEP